MLLSEINAYAMDELGDAVRDVISAHKLMLHTLAAIDYYDLQLQSSSKSSLSFKVPFNPVEQDGVIPAGLGTVTEGKFVRRKVSNFNTWNSWDFIDIVEDIEDLSRKANNGELAILFYGGNRYQLSWQPSSFGEVEDMEIWANADPLTKTGMAYEPQQPARFHRMFALRAVKRALPDLTLPPHGKAYTDFVIAKTGAVGEELRFLEHFWEVFVSNAADADTQGVADDYDLARDYGLGY